MKFLKNRAKQSSLIHQRIRKAAFVSTDENTQRFKYNIGLYTGVGPDYEWKTFSMISDFNTTVDEFTSEYLMKNDSMPTQILLATEIDQMLQPQFKAKEGFAWSLGWGLEEQQSETFFWQPGDNPGFKHFTAGSRSRREAVVVLTNGQNGWNICRPIVEAVFQLIIRAFDIY